METSETVQLLGLRRSRTDVELLGELPQSSWFRFDPGAARDGAYGSFNQLPELFISPRYY